MSQKQKQKLESLQHMLRESKKYLMGADKLLAEMLGHNTKTKRPSIDTTHFKVDKYPTGEETIEGVFNGLSMIGPDGSDYPVPENYASKSKLVEGDLMKLSITCQGRFIYKQIGPAPRERMRGVLEYDEEYDQYSVSAEGKRYHILKASITYYNGAAGDEVVIIVPKGRTSVWAALDSVIGEEGVRGRESSDDEMRDQQATVSQLEEI